MECPRCGARDVTTPACPRCGVIVAKALARPARPAPAVVPPAPVAEDDDDGGGNRKAWAAVVAVAVLLGLGVYDRKVARPRRAAEARAAEERALDGDVSAPGQATADIPRPPRIATASVAPPTTAQVTAQVEGLSRADRDQVDALVRHINRRGPMSASDVSGAEQLFAAHPGEGSLADLLETVLVSAADADRRRRDFASAAARLRRAAEVRPASLRARALLADVLTEAGDWAGAEAAARDALALDRGNLAAWQSLGYALMRLDRNREAAEVLRQGLEVRDDPTLKGLLAKIEGGMRAEQGMTEQQLAHFHVRYDGAAHEGVGREILRVLERHYATLTGTLDHQPASTIPVILFSREAYYDASGAPAWSGGVYDGLDGRIRIPIGGLTESLTPDMEGTLIHELTHAFVADRTRGVAPREIHEGLAQYMEGKRSATQYSGKALTALADGRVRGVAGFYYAALSYVEHLMATRGMGGMNELLRAMGETGNVDAAFRQVHGGTYQESRARWAEQLRRQHGS